MMALTVNHLTKRWFDLELRLHHQATFSRGMQPLRYLSSTYLSEATVYLCIIK